MTSNTSTHAITGSALGKVLVDRGLLDEPQLLYAMQKRAVENQLMGRLLIQNGLADETEVVRALAELNGLQFVNLDNLPEADPQVLAIFNREICLAQNFLPLRRVNNELEVLLGDADPDTVSQFVIRRAGMRCRFMIAEFSRVLRLIRHSYYFSQNPLELLVQREVKTLDDDPDHAHSPAKLLDYLLHLAVRERTTDIHITSSQRSLHVLFRIDGVLRPMMALPTSLSRLLGFIKLESEMDISEQRRPQDGSFRSVVLDAPLTVRVSTIITEHGERVVMRLLPEHNDLSGLKDLGFFPEDVAILERTFAKPSGLVLITGPTGSGKSSTLHAALRMQSLIERNVLTVEDPLEYRVPGAGQTEVNRRAGYDFNTALRHFLRHDPDVILLGEMRDAETAQAALEAAATGHLVLSTLHITTVFGVVPRLRPMKLEPQVIAENLLLIVNQRLVRQNCSFCTESVPFTSAECDWLGLAPGSMGRRGKGCERCRNSGFRGRMPVYEMLEIDEKLANAIADDTGREALRTYAYENGFRNIVSLAKRRVILGQTTSEEVFRVVGDGPTDNTLSYEDTENTGDAA
ncbi:MAG: GspE/PulE family protein [Candidimonas sp.]|jgi:type II secretory ATPase GspE/PulE/Tfp pilus assembly ATPase PilB-like protein